MRAIDSINGTIASQTSTAAQVLTGGQYQLSGASGNWNGATLAVDQLGGDGSTWVPSTILALAHVNGVVNGYLPPGEYRLTVSVATPTDPVYGSLCRIPGE
jgi:hypothetical protein